MDIVQIYDVSDTIWGKIASCKEPQAEQDKEYADNLARAIKLAWDQTKIVDVKNRP